MEAKLERLELEIKALQKKKRICQGKISNLKFKIKLCEEKIKW